MLMSEKITWHPTNAGNETRPVVWRLEGKQIVVFIGSVAVAVIAFWLLGADRGLGLLPNVVMAASIPFVTIAVVLRFFVGRPPSHFADYLKWAVQCVTGKRALVERPNNPIP